MMIKQKLQSLFSYDEREQRRAVAFATGAYVVVLFWALWLKFNDFHMVVLNYQWLSKLTVKERFLYNIIPFRVRYDKVKELLQFPANAIVFAPFGVFLNHLFPKKNIWRDLTVCFGVSLSIEIVQLFTIIGSFATDDLIMNTLGYFIGLAVYYLIFARLSTQQTVWLYRVVDAILFVALIVVIVTTVGNWELIHAILTRTL